VRIAVASDDGISIAGHFGRCAGFEIYDADQDQVTKVERRLNNNSHHHEQGDCGHHDHHDHGESVHSHESFLTALRDCQAVICRGMGHRAVADLTANGIKPVITAEDFPAQEAVKLYILGRLNQSGESQCCSH